MRYKNFLKVHKNTDEKMFAKYLSADGCFVKTNTINCDDNDDAIETEDKSMYYPDRKELLQIVRINGCIQY